MASVTILSDNGATSGSAGLKTSGVNPCSVYWLRLPEHTDMFSQGYVGISKNVSARWKYHRKSKENPHLTAAIKKYGFENLVKQIILIADKSYCLGIERKLRPSRKIGWNIEIGGGTPPSQKNQTSFAKGLIPWNKGVPMDDKIKAKVSESRKGKMAWNKGKPMPEETKAKVSSAKKGIPRDPALVEKTAAFNRGKKRPPEVVQKIVEARKRNKQLRALAKEVTQ